MFRAGFILPVCCVSCSQESPNDTNEETEGKDETIPYFYPIWKTFAIRGLSLTMHFLGIDSVVRRTAPSGRGRKPVVVDEDEEEEEEGTSGSSPAESTPPLEMDGGIRRSTRQRKFT